MDDYFKKIKNKFLNGLPNKVFEISFGTLILSFIGYQMGGDSLDFVFWQYYLKVLVVVCLYVPISRLIVNAKEKYSHDEFLISFFNITHAIAGVFYLYIIYFVLL